MECLNWTQRRACCLLQTRWRSALAWGSQLGVGEIMHDTPIVLRAVWQLSLCHWYCSMWITTSPSWRARVRVASYFAIGKEPLLKWEGQYVGGGGTLLLKLFGHGVVIFLLLTMAGGVKLNPGPPKKEGTNAAIVWNKAEVVLLNFVSDRCTIDLEGCHQCTAFSIFQVVPHSCATECCHTYTEQHRATV